MTLTELIMSANARGHIGVRGPVVVVSIPAPENLLAKAESLDLIRLVSAWRSTEDDLPEHRGGPVDRRVYKLTRKGWDVRINCRDTLSSYKASALAEALAAHYGELEEGPDLRYPEEAFDDWQSPVLYGSYTWGNYDTPTEDHPRVVMTKDGVLHDTPYGTPAHQHPRGSMPNTVIDPPMHTTKGEDVMRQSAKAPTDITPPPGYALIHDEIYPVDVVDTPYPGHEIAVPDDHWAHRVVAQERAYGWFLLACVLLATLAGLGWWLS